MVSTHQSIFCLSKLMIANHTFYSEAKMLKKYESTTIFFRLFFRLLNKKAEKRELLQLPLFCLDFIQLILALKALAFRF